ncbi:MAG: AzlD domain-containing protein [Treponema sp.]|nr:AzlD domain-containing protein [Treponema sp.]
MMLSLKMALFATVCIALVIFSERLFPFALFSKKDPPPLIRFIEKYIPSMVIAILIVYCLKDISFTASPFGAPQLIGVAAAVILHLTLNNPMVSIFGSTIIYMVLSRVLG